MNAFLNSSRIFDTQLDTKKIFVSMKYKFQPHNYIAKDGLSLLYLHVWEKYTPIKIPLDIYIDRKHWCFDSQRMIKKAKNFSDTNLAIDQIEAKITEIKIRYRLSETLLTPEKFIEEFKSGISRMNFLDYLKYSIEKDQNLARVEYNTTKKEKSVLKMLTMFKPKILFIELDIDLIDKFKKWRKSKGISDTTIATNLKTIKKYIGRAEEDGIKMKINKSQIKIGSTLGNREALTASELKILMSYYTSGFIKTSHKIPLCRFLFSCFTGMRIGDNQSINDDKILDGRVYFKAQKNKRKNNMILNKTATSILKICPEVFEIQVTDQHINRTLKEIMTLVGIKKRVTFHVSRHTFATNMLNAGVDIRVVQKLLDHKSIETTMIYSHLNQEQLDKGVLSLDNLMLGIRF